MLVLDCLIFYAWSRLNPRWMSRELGSLDWGAAFTIMGAWMAINFTWYLIWRLLYEAMTFVTSPILQAVSSSN